MEFVGVSNGWFKSYVSNRSQYVFINGYESGLAAINCGVPQRSVLGPLLFLFSFDLNRGCLVYMFSLSFSGSKFLINLPRQFRVRKIFSST